MKAGIRRRLEKLSDLQVLTNRLDSKSKFPLTQTALPNSKTLVVIINYQTILCCGITLRKKFFSGSVQVANITDSPKRENFLSFLHALFINMILLKGSRQKRTHLNTKKTLSSTSLPLAAIVDRIIFAIKSKSAHRIAYVVKSTKNKMLRQKRKITQLRNVAIAAKDLANVETIVIVDLSANVALNSCHTEPANVMKDADVDQVASALAHVAPKISKSFAPKRLTRKI